MQETIIVIFIVTIIVGIAIFTFYQLQLRSIDNLKLELEQNRNLILLSTLSNSVELSHTSLGNEENALDTIKLLNPSLENLGFKEITVRQVYPSSQNVLCTKSNYPECNKYVVYNKKPSKIKNTQVISLPISIYFPYSNEYKLGILEVRSYS